MDNTKTPNYTISIDNPKKYLSGNPLVKILMNNFYLTIFKLIEFCLPFENLIDVGCGEGFSIYKLRKRFPVNMFSIVGADINKESLEICRCINPNIPLYEENIYKLSFPSKEFDVVMCLESLEHLQYPEDAIKELCRISKRYLLLSVPNEPFFSLSAFIRGKYVRSFGRTPEHLQFWTSYNFVKVISKNTRVLKLRRPFPWTVALCEVIDSENINT